MMPKSFGVLVSLFCWINISCNSNPNPNNKAVDIFSEVSYKDLTDAIKNSTHAESVYLTNATDESLDTLILLPNLSRVKFFNSRIDIKSACLKLGKLKKLRFLGFEDCLLKQIPHEIIELDRLQELEISGDTLEFLSNNLFLLNSLETLSIITKTISDSINMLQNLKSVSVKIVDSKEVPESIMELRNLEYLEIPSNVSTLPSNLGKLKNLKKINITGSDYEKKIKNVDENSTTVSISYIDSIEALKKQLPLGCIIITSGNIKY